jgi:hypothetical protein
LGAVFSSEPFSVEFEPLTSPSDGPLMAANLTGAVSHVQRANALTARAALQDEQRGEV